MRGWWLSPFLAVVLLVGTVGPASAGQPIMLQFREVAPSPQMRKMLVSFAEKMEAEDAEFFNGIVAFDEFKTRVMEWIEDDFFRLKFLYFSKEFFLKTKEGLGKSFFSNMAGGSKWQFVKLRRFQDRQFALFRVPQSDGSLVFLDFELGETAEDGLRVVDWYDYVSSRWGSEGIAAGAEFAVKAMSMAKQGTGNEEKAIGAFMGACRSRNFPEIFARYQQLPESLRRHPFARHIYRIAATTAGDESYEQALAEISKEGYSIERSFFLVDYYFLKGDYEKARQAVTDFSTLLQGDVALDDLLASIYLKEGKYLQSVLACETAILKDPEYEKAYLTLLTAFAVSRCYRDAILVLDLLETRFRYDFALKHFEKIEEFKDFAHSRELKEWLAQKKQ